MERSVPDGLNNPKFEEAYETFMEYYQAHCQIKTDAYPGILDLLKSLKDKGYKMAIVSNKAQCAVSELKIYRRGNWRKRSRWHWQETGT